MAVAWYRFRSTLGRRWGGYLSLILLIGLVGGTGMAAIAGGRRTQSAYPAFLKSTNPSDMNVSAFRVNSAGASGSGTNLSSALARLPEVKHVASGLGLNAYPLHPDGSADTSPAVQLIPAASADGLYSTQDRPGLVRGRMWHPDRTDEIVATASAAQVLGLRLGQSRDFGFYSDDQLQSPDFGTPALSPEIRANVKLVGIVKLTSDVVQDDVDRFPTFVIFSPAVAQIMAPATTVAYYAIQLRHGTRDITAFEQGFLKLLPPSNTYNFHVTANNEAQVERSVKPGSIALGVFGIIAAVATLLIALQAVSRQLRAGEEDAAVLRALGAGPMTTASDALIGILGAILLGSLLAVGVAAAASPLSPIGPVRPTDPHLGIDFDWTVLGYGLIVLVVGLGGMALALAYRGAPHRVARRARVSFAPSSAVARVASSSGVPIAGVVGTRFALEPGRGRTAVPVRSALTGSVLAVLMVVATLTFGGSLHALVSRPALYGWNWSYGMTAGQVVPAVATDMLDHDPDVVGWLGIDTANATINGQNVSIILMYSTNGKVAPPILSGHGMTGEGQVVLGAATLAKLHKKVGDTVMVGYGTPDTAPVYVPPTPLKIVGTATMPAIGYPSVIGDHPTMGTGALVSVGIEPPAFKEALTNPNPNLNGPSDVLVRLKEGISPSGRAVMQRVADATNKILAADASAEGNQVSLISVQHPAEIVNYKSTGSTPAILALGLAAGAVVALGLTLIASVHRRRRDLALLKTLGFTQRQLATTVAWQASVAAVVGLLIGVPLGIIVGRQFWILFARNIHAVPQPVVPMTSVIIVAVGAVILANVVAAFPGRIAARTPMALMLRAE
jgi:hypothetical protein